MSSMISPSLPSILYKSRHSRNPGFVLHAASWFDKTSMVSGQGGHSQCNSAGLAPEFRACSHQPIACQELTENALQEKSPSKHQIIDHAFPSLFLRSVIQHTLDTSSASASLTIIAMSMYETYCEDFFQIGNIPGVEGKLFCGGKIEFKKLKTFQGWFESCDLGASTRKEGLLSHVGLGNLTSSLLISFSNNQYLYLYVYFLPVWSPRAQIWPQCSLSE